MSNEVETHLSEQLDKLLKFVYALIALGFGFGVWVTSIQFKIATLEFQTSSMQRRIERIDYYVQKIATKVGIEVEPPQ